MTRLSLDSSSRSNLGILISKLKANAFVIQVLEEEFEVDVSEESTDFNLLWMDTGVQLETVMRLQPWQKVNHFPGMMEICRKDSLVRNLNRISRHSPDDYDFYPKSFYLPNDYQALMDYSAKHRCYFIAKPDASSQGRGIFLFKDVSRVSSDENDMIVQQYLNQPLLLNGFKFDLRVYVCVTSPSTAYIYSEGLARFATIQYQSPNSDNLDLHFMHLTNYAVNKQNPVFDKSEEGSKRRLSDVLKSLEGQTDVKILWSKIKDIVRKTLVLAEPVIQRNYEATSSSAKLLGTADSYNQCFELLGFDIILDRKFKPWLLEVNHAPSFSCGTDIDTQVKRSLLRDTIKLCCADLNREKLFRKIIKQSAKSRLLSNSLSVKEFEAAPEPDSLGEYEKLSRDGLDHLLTFSKDACSLELRETIALKIRKSFLEKKKREQEEKLRALEEWRETQRNRPRPVIPPAPKAQTKLLLPKPKFKFERQLLTTSLVNLSDCIVELPTACNKRRNYSR